MILSSSAVLAALLLASPADTVRSAERQAHAALAAGKGRAALARLADAYVDYEELARRSLAAEWPRLAAPERARITRALRTAVDQTLLGKLQPGPVSYTLALKRATQRGADAEVPAVLRSGKQEVPLAFRLHRTRAGRWLLHDLAIAGIGLLDGYEQQLPQLYALGGTARVVSTLENAGVPARP